MISADGEMISDKIAIFVIALIGLILTGYLIWHEIQLHRIKHRKDDKP